MIHASLLLLLVAATLHTGTTIKCYICDSNTNIHCTEDFDPALIGLEPQECENMHEAAYCIKTTGMYKGEVGTTRACSSRDQGNICDFQKRKGDLLEWRACVYTCRADGCNGSTSVISSAIVILVASAIALRLWAT